MFDDRYEAPETREVLAQVRRSLGPVPRRFSWWDRLTYLRIARPWWAARDDLRRFFSSVSALLADGDVVWGHVIQANQLLFDAGTFNCPGEVVYADDPAVPPEELAPIAERLFALKGTQPAAPDERAVADYLTNERVRVFGWRVPESVSGPLACRISTVFIPRKHLPKRRLVENYFPLLVSSGADGTAMVVPSRYWPREFAQFWAGETATGGSE